MLSPKMLRTRTPQVKTASEFLEITRDFTDPKDVVREAISNALDWGATEIRLSVHEEKSEPHEDLTITIEDNGLGMDEERLHAFFDLGNSTNAGPSGRKIGYKGHGTKIYYNSKEIEVWSESADATVYAIMKDPLKKLIGGEIPEYEYDVQKKPNEKTKTRIIIRDYNRSNNKGDFAHKVLRDYILWFTAFGSVEHEVAIAENIDKTVLLSGLGQATPETVGFGHPFPKENHEISKLQKQGGDWTKRFVKRWVFKGVTVKDNPGKALDIVFYVEGDEAKKSYNPMIRSQGKKPEYGMYKVEDRYGLWACRDYIPVERHNEWLGLGQRLETKYHAFVNCQDFRLTANRGDIGNTPPDLLRGIQDTVRDIFEDRIHGSKEYKQYEEQAELAEQYQTAEQEAKDFERRRTRAKTKKVCVLKGVELIEPSLEVGVVALFNLVYAHRPDLFSFRVIDYDSHKGYDAVVAERTAGDLTKEAMSFVEFKNRLPAEFNHAFDHLAAVVCWDCSLATGTEVFDIKDQPRELRITPPSKHGDHTHFSLVTSTGKHNIEVFVLKEYLRERLKLEFKPRASKT